MVAAAIVGEATSFPAAGEVVLMLLGAALGRVGSETVTGLALGPGLAASLARGADLKTVALPTFFILSSLPEMSTIFVARSDGFLGVGVGGFGSGETLDQWRGCRRLSWPVLLLVGGIQFYPPPSPPGPA